MKPTARARVFALAFALAANVAAGVHSGTNLHLKRIRRSFVRSLAFKYTLRVCNAYPFSSAIDLYMEGATGKLNEEPMVYKTCKDFTPPVTPGDRVDFKVGDTNVGTFTISDLPNNDAILLMVVYRHDTYTNAVAFESHVFSNVASAQVAVLDVYKGRDRAELRIIRTSAEKEADDDFPVDVPHSELLQFDSVLAVDSSIYNLALQGVRDNKTRAQKEFVALPREAYVVIRCGVDAEDGPDYPEDLIVYPHSDKTAFSGAFQLQPSSLLVLTVLCSLLVGMNA